MKKSRVCWRRTRSAANSSDRASMAQRRSRRTRSRKITSRIVRRLAADQDDADQDDADADDHPKYLPRSTEPRSRTTTSLKINAHTTPPTTHRTVRRRPRLRPFVPSRPARPAQSPERPHIRAHGTARPTAVARRSLRRALDVERRAFDRSRRAPRTTTTTASSAASECARPGVRAQGRAPNVGATARARGDARGRVESRRRDDDVFIGGGSGPNVEVLPRWC